MEKSSSQKALKVVSIIMIVMSALMILAGLFLTIGGGAMGSASIDANDEASAAMAGFAIIGGIMILIGGIVDLIIGILGLRGANNPQKIGVFFVLAIIGVAFSLFSLLGTLFGGSADASMIASSVASLIFPGICVFLAYNIKKENNL